MMRLRKAFGSRRMLLIALTMVAMLGVGLAAPTGSQDLTAIKNAFVTVKRGVKRTTVRLSGSAGSIAHVVALEKNREVEFQRVRSGVPSVLSCAAAARKCSSLMQRGEKELTACACLQGNEKIVLSAGGEKQTAADFFRFFGDFDSDGGSGGSTEPVCWESEEEQMSICEP